ncbi:transcriptional regulator PpsR [Rhodobacter sp. Har01]|nr:transcriptional regulator PpsR [Rhodobacter sp. Har01]MCB6176810.1 transcriptional regulator PpsR [Rhodobacter sp. Har01]
MMNAGKIPLIAPDLLTDILATASDVALLVSPQRRILSVLVNPMHRAFGQLADWEGLPLAEVLASESLAKYEARLPDVGNVLHQPVAMELNHRDRENWPYPVRYTLHRVSHDDSVLMLGHDLRPVAEVQQQLVAAQLALERDYESQREMDTRYRVLMEISRDPVVMVSMSTGRIADLNPAAALVLGAPRAELLGAAIAQEFEGRRRGEFLEALSSLAVSERAAPIELMARRSQRRLILIPTVFRAAGERIVVCQLDVGDKAALTDDLSDSMGRLYHEGVDGIVFTDGEGVIRSANEAFLNLIDAANIATVRGRSVADYLVRGSVDLRVLLDTVKRTGHLRMYSTRLATDFSGQIAAEISASWLNDRPNPVLALVIRDASRVESMRRPPTGMTGEDGSRNVMELVGASTLKEIVAETTDVIERMCIETALELTRNNRVAAADMLSLSRQSLYVKLRKYGLINKDGE